MSSLHNSDAIPSRRPAKVIPLRPGTKIRRHPVRRAFRTITRLVIGMVVLSLAATVSLNWWTPPATSHMLQSGLPVTYQYVSMDHISRFTVASVWCMRMTNSALALAPSTGTPSGHALRPTRRTSPTHPDRPFPSSSSRTSTRGRLMTGCARVSRRG